MVKPADASALRAHLKLIHGDQAADTMSFREAVDRHHREHEGAGARRLHVQPRRLHQFSAEQPKIAGEGRALTEFTVMWAIDVSAADQLDAVVEALRLIRKAGTEATVFHVEPKGGGPVVDVDLHDQRCVFCGHPIHLYVGDMLKEWLDEDGYATCPDRMPAGMHLPAR